MKTRAALTIGCVALLGAACSESLDTTGRNSEQSSAAAGPLVPQVICVNEENWVYFGYDNQSADVVVLDASASVLVGNQTDDEPFVPVAFAPGRNSPALYAIPERVGDEISWTITGPDGVARTAALSADTPACTAGLLAPTNGDDRTPRVEVVGVTLGDTGDEAEWTVELTGVPEVSVCAAPFDPQAPIVRLDVIADLVDTPVEGRSLTTTMGVDDDRSEITVIASVIDRCGYEGETYSSWPVGGFEALLLGDDFCADVVDGGPDLALDEDGECDGSRLPPTGGVKIRNG